MIFHSTRKFISAYPLCRRIRNDFRQFRKFYVHWTICGCIIISMHARIYPSYTMNYNSYWLSGGAQFSTNFSTNSLTIEMLNTKDLLCRMSKFTSVVGGDGRVLCFITLAISSFFFNITPLMAFITAVGIPLCNFRLKVFYKSIKTCWDKVVEGGERLSSFGIIWRGVTMRCYR